MKRAWAAVAAAAATVVVLLVSAAAPGAFASNASASSTYSATYVSAAAAFDGNTSTYWQGAYSSANPAATTPYDITSWRLTWGYAQPMTVSRVTVTYASDARFIATGAEIDCSTDGSTWTALASVPGGQQTATIAVTGTCQWVSLLMGAPTSGFTPAVSELAIAAVAAPPTPQTATSVVAVGDSITAGSYAPISWPSELPIWREIPVYNQGVSGNTTAQMLSRFSTVLGTGGQIVVIMGGTNDCQVGVDTATTISNIDSMVSQSLTAVRLPVLVGPIPRNSLTDAGASYASCLTSLRAALSNDAQQRGLMFADPWGSFENPAGSAHLDDALTEDGVHPNARGAFILARVVAHALGWGFNGD